MAKASKKTRKLPSELEKKTKAELIGNVEQLQRMLRESEERTHHKCTEWQDATDKHKNDPTLIKNMIKDWTLAFNRFGIGMKIMEENYFTFIKDDVEVRLHYRTLLRVGMEQVLEMFSPIKGLGILDNDEEANEAHKKGLVGTQCPDCGKPR